MKKIILIVLSLIFAVGMTGCGKDDKKPITLTLDNNSAYFVSQTKLLPIKGESLSPDDTYEQATINISANRKCKIRLVLEFAENQTEIPTLRISVNNFVYNFENNTVLYESDSDVDSVSVEVKIYLGKDTPISAANTVVAFYFALYAV